MSKSTEKPCIYQHCAFSISSRWRVICHGIRRDLKAKDTKWILVANQRLQAGFPAQNPYLHRSMDTFNTQRKICGLDVNKAQSNVSTMMVVRHAPWKWNFEFFVSIYHQLVPLNHSIMQSSNWKPKQCLVCVYFRQLHQWMVSTLKTLTSESYRAFCVYCV